MIGGWRWKLGIQMIIICGIKRRFGRLAKTKARYKQKASCSQEEEEADTNSKDSDKNSGDGQEKVKDAIEK
jgi:hypothetical protein